MSKVNNPNLRALWAAVAADIPTLLWGIPGIGKTAMIETDYKAAGYFVETLVGSSREPTDFLGLPVLVDGKQAIAQPDWVDDLNNADKGLLFLDELTTCAPSVQRAMLRIIQERRVGRIPLGDSVRIIAAANESSAAIDTYDLSAAMSNRFLHLDMVLDGEEMAEGDDNGFVATPASVMKAALGSGSDADWAYVKGLTRGFTKARPDLLAKLPQTVTEASRGWPSARSWTNLREVLALLKRDDLAAWAVAARGLVGEAVGNEFMVWMAVADLHDPDEVLADPTIVDWRAERPDRLFVLMTSVQALVTSRGDAKTWEAGMRVLTECANNGKPDVATPAVTHLLNNKPAKAATPDGVADAFTDMLIRSGRLIDT